MLCFIQPLPLPLQPATHTASSTCSGLFLQGYGLTETCAASCIAVPDEWDMHGTNGPVTPCTEMMLESVPGVSLFCESALDFQLELRVVNYAL